MNVEEWATPALFPNSLYPGVPSTLDEATVYNRLPRSLILTNLRTRTVRHRAGLSSPRLRQIARLGARVSALAILYTVVRETDLGGKEIFPSSDDAK